MTTPANVTLQQGAASAYTVGAGSGADALSINTLNHAYTVDANGNLWEPGLQTSTVAASGAINTTETLINTPLAIGLPGSPLTGLSAQVGASVRFTIQGTCTASAGNASTFTMRAGTLGTKSDASVATWAITSATSGTTIPFFIIITYTIRTTGAPGTGNGFMQTNNQGTTGIFTAVADVRSTASNTGMANTATFIDLTYLSAATTTTCTFQNVITEWLPA